MIFISIYNRSDFFALVLSLFIYFILFKFKIYFSNVISR
jgi:hypothetical protein